MATRPSSALDDEARSHLPLSPVVLHVLLALADRNRHGLGIAGQVEANTAGHLQLGPGTLYGAIKRLLELGLVADTDESPEGDRADPRRRYYRLTPLGRRALALESTQMVQVLKVARTKRVL